MPIPFYALCHGPCATVDVVLNGFSVDDFYKKLHLIRSHLKNRIFVQGRGGAESQPEGILVYFEDFERDTNPPKAEAKRHFCDRF
jgi:hypothetical protein